MYEMKNSIKFSFPSPIEVHINIILSRVFSFLRKRKKESKKIPERIGLKRIIILKMKLETGGGKKIIKAWLGIRENLIHDKFPPPLKLFNVSLGGMNCQTFSLPPLENTPISWQKKKKKSNKRERRKGRKRRKTASLFPRRVKRCSLLLFCHVASRTNTIYYYSFDPLLSLSCSLALARSLAHSRSRSRSRLCKPMNFSSITTRTDRGIIQLVIGISLYG